MAQPNPYDPPSEPGKERLEIRSPRPLVIPGTLIVIALVVLVVLVVAVPFGVYTWFSIRF